jgi:hypothetical protein
MTSKLSRRSMLTRAAAGTAIATLPSAVNAAQPSDDPIFAVIAEHRRAAAVCSDAADAMHSCGDPHPPTGLAIGERPDMRFEGVTIDGEDYVRRVPTGEMVPIVVRHVLDIEANAPNDLSAVERAAWIDEKLAELDRHNEAETAAQEATPRHRAWRAFSDASDVLDTVTERLCTPIRSPWPASRRLCSAGRNSQRRSTGWVTWKTPSSIV